VCAPNGYKIKLNDEFIFSRIKKGEGQGKEKCHAKSMMSKEANWRLKRDTQHVPLRQNTEERVQEMGLTAV
jgi:hypothetical protein